MGGLSQKPAWYRDVKWVASLLLVPSLAAAIFAFSLASLTAEPMAKRVLESVLQVTLLPEGGTDVIGVQPDFDYRSGDSLQVLPGVEVFASPEELGRLSAEEARNRVAERLTETLTTQGRAAAASLVGDTTLSEQLEVAFERTLPALVTMYLEAALLPEGLTDGSRVADWQLQAEQFPGEPVQPVVGVFITLPPQQLASFDDRKIGEFIVERLSAIYLSEGRAAAQTRVGNEELQIRLSEALGQEVRQSVQGHFETLLVPYDSQIANRFERAKDALDRQEAALASQARLQTLTGVSGDLSPEEANRAVLNRLADVAYTGGLGEVIAIVNDAQQAARLEAAAGATRLFSQSSRERFVSLSWVFGALAGGLLLVLVFFSRGANRLLNAGIFIALASVLGSWTFWQLELAVANHPASAPPISLGAAGVIGYLQGLLKYLASSLPQDAFRTLLYNHLAVLGFGVGLIVLYVVVQLSRAVKPRRRRSLI